MPEPTVSTCGMNGTWAAMMKAELMGPNAAEFWLATLRKKDETPKREFLTLADAAARLGCQWDGLLDKGLSGELALYAPVLHEGLYVWPVTERGIPHARLLGTLDVIAPVFEERLQYGDYGMLMPFDLRKITIEQSVKASGYICPERVHRHLVEWGALLQEEATTLLRRMRRLATQVAWVPAFPPEAEVGMIRAEMLRVNLEDVQRFTAKPSQSFKVGASDEKQGHLLPESETEIASLLVVKNSGLTILEQQIRAIEGGADVLKLKHKAIERGGKKKLLNWCLENYPDLFTSASKSGDSKFNEAWKVASRQDRIISKDRDSYAKRR